jgi:membrane protein implicated in regulation of membrane protease activity
VGEPEVAARGSSTGAAADGRGGDCGSAVGEGCLGLRVMFSDFCEVLSRVTVWRKAADMSWIAWLIAAAILGVAEYFTLTLAFGLLAAAALVAALVAGMDGPLLAQVLAFAITAGVGLVFVRPIARRQMTNTPLVREGSYALIGKKAVVVEEVTGTQGLIKLSGEVWSARALDESQVIPAGTPVDVMEIEGATAIVYPRELLP